MQAKGLTGHVHGARIGSKLPPLPPQPAARFEVPQHTDGVTLSQPLPSPPPSLVARPAPASPPPAAPAAAPLFKPATPFSVALTMQDTGPQFFLGGPPPAVPTPGPAPVQSGNVPKTIADIRAQSDREVNAIMNGIAQSTHDTTQRYLEAMRGGGSSQTAAAPAPPPPPAPKSLSSSQKSTLQQLIKKGVNADYARSLVEANDQFKIRLLNR